VNFYWDYPIVFFNFLHPVIINWLGRYARVIDHLAVENVAQGPPVRGGPTLEDQDKNNGNLILFLPYYYPLWLILIIRTFVFTLNISFFGIYSVILTFYFYWSHRSMINNQCTCHYEMINNIQ